MAPGTIGVRIEGVVSPSKAGIVPAPPAWPEEGATTPTTVEVTLVGNFIDWDVGVPDGTASLSVGCDVPGHGPLAVATEKPYSVEKDSASADGKDVVRFAGTWGGLGTWEGRPAYWQYAGWERVAAHSWGSPQRLDLVSRRPGLLNWVCAGPSVGLTGEWNTVRVVGGGFDASHASSGKVWLYHDGALVAESGPDGDPRVVEFDLANARRYKAFEVDVLIPADAPVGVYDIEVKIGDVAVAAYESSSTVGSSWAGANGGLKVPCSGSA